VGRNILDMQSPASDDRIRHDKTGTHDYPAGIVSKLDEETSLRGETFNADLASFRAEIEVHGQNAAPFTPPKGLPPQLISSQTASAREIPASALSGQSISEPIDLHLANSDVPACSEQLAGLLKAGKDRQRLASEHFIETARPFILEGQADRPTLLLYGGLAGTGWPWRELAINLNKDCGNRAEIYALKGHDGTWSGIVKNTHEDWVNDVIEKAEACKARGFKPVYFGFSTGAIAGVEAAARRPDLFSALVLVGAPTELKSWKQTLAMTVCEWLDRKVPGCHAIFQRLAMPLPADPPGSDPENILSQQPILSTLPFTTYISLLRLQRNAKEALKDVRCPVLVIQGTEDKYVSIQLAEKMFKQLASEQKEFLAFEESPHPVMLGKHRERFKNKVKDWYNRFAQYFVQSGAAQKAE
jgi:esterase/lipase